VEKTTMFPVFPAIQKLFEEKNLSIKNFDAVYNDVISAANDGYFTILENDSAAYLFIVGGRPYASGRAEKDGLSLLDVQDFFDAYTTIGNASVVFYKVEKKLLLSILVYFKKRPAHKFTADMVDMEKVLNELAQKGANSIIAVSCGEKLGFCICLKGRPSFNYLPDGAYAQEEPKDGLLLYLFAQKVCVPSIEIFDDIQMLPVHDGISPKEELPKSLTAHYVEKTSIPVSVKDTKIILMHADKIINQYTITKEETTIGRGAGCDIVIDNSGVSRHHAVIKEKDGTFFVEDKGSTNGTFIKGEKIGMKEIKNGDIIQILNYAIIFKCPQPDDAGQASFTTRPAVSSEVTFEAKAKSDGQSKLVFEDGKEHILKSTVTTMGIGDDMELKLEGKGIAKHQASILRGKNGEFTIMHKGGRAATKVNGEKVQELHFLKKGDVLELGRHKIKYVIS